jgi:hypothetical protein
MAQPLSAPHSPCYCTAGKVFLQRSAVNLLSTVLVSGGRQPLAAKCARESSRDGPLSYALTTQLAR